MLSWTECVKKMSSLVTLWELKGPDPNLQDPDEKIHWTKDESWASPVFWMTRCFVSLEIDLLSWNRGNNKHKDDSHIKSEKKSRFKENPKNLSLTQKPFCFLYYMRVYPTHPKQHMLDVCKNKNTYMSLCSVSIPSACGPSCLTSITQSPLWTAARLCPFSINGYVMLSRWLA